MMTLQEYLLAGFGRNVVDHHVRASVDEQGRVSLYIHPECSDGETLDFEVLGNGLLPSSSVVPAPDAGFASS